jgi:hypothetical protein
MASPPPSSSTLKRHHFSGFTRRQHRFLCAAFGEHRNPVLDEIGRLAVDLQPGQPVSKDPAVGEGALRPHARPEITQTSLESQNLSQPFDISPRERQRAHARDGWALLS